MRLNTELSVELRWICESEALNWSAAADIAAADAPAPCWALNPEEAEIVEGATEAFD